MLEGVTFELLEEVWGDELAVPSNADSISDMRLLLWKCDTIAATMMTAIAGKAVPLGIVIPMYPAMSVMDAVRRFDIVVLVADDIAVQLCHHVSGRGNDTKESTGT